MNAQFEIRALDTALVDTLNRLWSIPKGLRDVILQASAAVGEGHHCLDLSEYAKQKGQDSAPLLALLEQWPGCGNGESATALVCNGQRLYLRRYWQYEKNLATAFLQRATISSELVEPARSSQALNQLFGETNAKNKLQKVAAALALSKSLTLIMGGPGSGKTFTLIRALIAMQMLSAQPLKLAIAAPTGKAAARVTEGLHAEIGKLALDENVKAALPQRAITLHKLLGIGLHGGKPRFNAERKLPIDVLVIDEASMVDLPLMCKVIAALPESARLIVVGDPDQLASVEAGAVISEIRSVADGKSWSADLTQHLNQVAGTSLLTAGKTSPLSDCVVTLNQAHRYAEQSTLHSILQNIRSGNEDGLIAALAQAPQEIVWHRPEHGDEFFNVLQYATAQFARWQNMDKQQALENINQTRVLCALRKGPFGVEEINAAIARNLFPNAGAGHWQQGQPLMVLRNDADLNLANGDTGIVWRAEDHSLGVTFSHLPDQSFTLGDLPEHELAYAITVHKSQGSEFDEICVVLPEAGHPLVSREWLYTALSRSRGKLQIFASEAALRAALQNRTQRMSGLAQRLVTR